MKVRSLCATMTSRVFTLHFVLSTCLSDAETEPRHIFRPVENTLILTQFNNSDTKERDKALEVSWSYEADKVNSTYTQENKADIRFRLKSYNHDGLILFGISNDGNFGGSDMVLIKHGCLR